MKIDFAKKELEKCANKDSYRLQKMGAIRSKLYKQRLDDLDNAESLEDTRHLPGHYHELVENRKGQWAVNLDQPYRLIFEPQEEPIPIDTSGKYIWTQIKSVRILEIENYHKQG
ncbi:MAG: type II toxin-antitoxin system RelE/ParE family toxin [bacterium]